MVIVHFCGALGNQLFQYALYRKISLSGIEVKADISSFYDGQENRFFYLEKLGIELKIATEDEIKKIKKNNIINALLKRDRIITEKKTYCYDEKILEIKDGYLEGYWQNPMYFKDIRELLLSDIHFFSLPEEQSVLANRIKKEHSVAIHIRMGDYLKYKDKYGGICNLDYYERAIDYINKTVTRPIFYGFSDDIMEAREYLENKNIEWINYNNEKTAYNDLFLMTLCKHNIIANSSFSWWGAFLGTNSNKIVIAPTKWINRDEDSNIKMDKWICL